MGIIGRRFRVTARVALGIAAVLVLGALLAARSPDPFVADPAAAAALRAAVASDRALAVTQLVGLRDALSAALADGRQGAALTVQGTQRPGPQLTAAAEAIGRGDARVDDVEVTLRRLASELAVLGRPAPSPLALKPGQLAGIGAQLATSADAADGFWSMRRATAATLDSLQDAFAAVDARDPDAALTEIAAAEASLATVRAWPSNLLTLPFWTKATGDLLAALRSLAIALRDHDVAGARAAEARYRSATASAHQADVALAVAIAEGGSAVSDTPLAAAVLALRAVQDALDEVRSILV